MKCAYKLSNLEVLSSINKTTLDADEIEVDFPGPDMDVEFYRVVGGEVARKSDAEIQNTVFQRRKPAKEDEIRTAFEFSVVQPVIYNGISWDGGFNSALKLDGVRRMAEIAGQIEVTFWDASNTPHTLSIADATVVCLVVSVDYSTKFAKKQGYMNDITAASTDAELDAIHWEN